MITDQLRYYTSVDYKQEWIPIFNDRVAVRVPGEYTSDEFSLIEIESAPGGGVPLHVHQREDEIFTVLEGICTFEFRDTTFEAGPGSVTVLPRQIRHAWGNRGQTPLRVQVMLRPAGFERFFAENLRNGGDPERMKGMLKVWYGITML